MAMPNFTMKELLEAGIHFGHQTNRWNPKMETYLYGERNGIHIIDLQQTVPLLNNALKVLRDVAASGGRVLFVGTKRQAQKIVSENAVNSGQYFMNHRWLGGTLTNWSTISKSIDRLKGYDELLQKEDSGLTKKEIVGVQRQRNKLDSSLGGIKDMSGVPDALFVIDTNKEHIAIKEANVLKIPVIAVVDSNSNPEGVDYPIPGNDDATRSIALYCRLVSESILDGLKDSFSSSGKDIGASSEGLVEENINNLSKSKDKISDNKDKKSFKGKITNKDSDKNTVKDLKKSVGKDNASSKEVKDINASKPGDNNKTKDKPKKDNSKVFNDEPKDNTKKSKIVADTKANIKSEQKLENKEEKDIKISKKSDGSKNKNESKESTNQNKE